jgi:hypothetical protein
VWERIPFVEAETAMAESAPASIIAARKPLPQKNPIFCHRLTQRQAQLQKTEVDFGVVQPIPSIPHFEKGGSGILKST